jgi:hypothetical protein
VFEINAEAAKILIKEGKRVGKTPWCCCGITEDYVFEQLNGFSKHNPNVVCIQRGNTTITTNQSFSINGVLFNSHVVKYPQETMEETCNRRNIENSL